MTILAVRAPNPIWLFDDLTGNLLNDQYYIFFLTNVFPYVPQNVYRDDLGSATWPFPLEFFPNGTLPDNLFFDPTLTYRIEIRAGNTQTDQLIYEINDFVPGSGSGPSPTPIATVFQNSENLITNPQFEVINFVSNVSNPYTYTQGSSGNYVLHIAPGWDLLLSGTGTTVLEQKNFSGVDNAGVPGDPPYAIHIENTGWSSAVLRQYLNKNGAIFSGGTVSAYLLAYPYNSPQAITINYVPSNNASQTIATATLPASQFSALSGVININPSTNTDVGDFAYVAIDIVLQPTQIIDITNVQFLGTSTAASDPTMVAAPIYGEQSIERQEDYLAHYYDPYLANKPITNYLLGWNFATNPCQDLGPNVAAAALGANKARYIADQTIAFESVSDSLSYVFDPTVGLTISTTADSQFALIQYLGAAEAKQILLDNNYFGKIAVAINGNSTVSSINCNIKLFYTTNVSLPSAPIETNNTVFFTSLTAGVPTGISVGWTEVPRADGYGPATFTLTTSSEDTPFSFSYWDSGIQPATVTYFAIVIGFDTLTAGNTVRLDYCTLCKGNFATPPPAMNAAQTLQGLQYYYQKSFIQGLVPAQNVGLNNGETIFLCISSGSTCWFPINLQTPMNQIPLLTLYNPAAANALIRDITAVSDYNPTNVVQVNKNCFYISGAINGTPGDVIAINWVADGRLGQV